MMGNTFGRHFRVTTFGESHGVALGTVIDGVPAGLRVSKEDIQSEMDRRRPGQSNVTSPRTEKDEIEILSGIFEEKTTGAPVCIIVRNKDADSSKYEQIKHLFRPGHADYAFLNKYGMRDYRGGGRSSGRETLCRVAAGAVAKKIITGTKVIAYTLQVGNIRAEKIDYGEIEKNSVRCPDKTAAKKMEKLIESVKKEGDSIGGIIEVVVKNPPQGLGDPVFDKLDADIAKAILSIGAVKGIEFGSGFGAAGLKGSENNDSFYSKAGKISTRTNNAGGISGGISTGQDIIFRAVIKAPSSITKEQSTVDDKGKATKISVEGRHDPCLCPRAVPVIEHMTNIVLADAVLAQRLVRA
ncbi:chorismate synthase [Candidatus Woesearchaeota archaeon]|nr:chorismate synthase [Candidatus Woesearchaeota archaeon]